MNILITTDLFTTATNGVVTLVKNLYEELRQKGHDVRILTLSESVCSHKDDVVYYIRSMPIGVYPDIRMPLSYRHSLIKELINWKPDVIHSQKVLNGYALDKPICIVPSGICLEQHKKRFSEETRHSKRVRLGLSDEQLVLINLGRLGMEKNLEELLHIFAKARVSNDKLVLLIVGDGPAKGQLERKADSLGCFCNV